MASINIELGKANPSKEVRKILTPITTRTPAPSLPSAATSLPKVQIPLTPDLFDTKMADEIAKQKDEQSKIVRDLQEEETAAVQMGALFNQYTLVGNAMFHFDTMFPDLKKDDTFDYYARRSEFETGLLDWQIGELRSEGGTLNEKTARALSNKFQEMNIRDGITSRMNPAAALALGVIAGAPDILVGAPLFRAGQMLGKAAQSSKYGGQMLGNFSPVVNYAVEGGAIGLGYAAALDAMGEHYDLPAYIHTAAFGGLLNVPLSGALRGFTERPPIATEVVDAAIQEAGKTFEINNDLYDPKRMDVLLGYTHKSPEAALDHLMQGANDYTATVYMEAVKNIGSTDPNLLRAEIARLHGRDMAEMFKPQEVREAKVPLMDENLVNKVVNGKATQEELKVFTEWAETIDALPKQGEPYSKATVDRWQAGKATEEDIKLIEEQIGEVGNLSSADKIEAIALLRTEAPDPAKVKTTFELVTTKGSSLKTRKAMLTNLRQKLKEQEGSDGIGLYEEALKRMDESPKPVVAPVEQPTKPLDKRKAKKLERKGQLPKEEPIKTKPKDDIDVMVEEVKAYSSTREALLADPVFSKAMEDGTIIVDLKGTIIPEKAIGGVSYKKDIADRVILNKDISKDYVATVMWHELAHIRISKMVGTMKEYFDYVSVVKQSKELMDALAVAKDIWRGTREVEYAYIKQVTGDEQLANDVADAALFEEVVADLYAASKDPRGLNTAFKEKYDVELPKDATNFLGKAIQSFTKWLAKTFPSIFKATMTEQDVIRHLSKLDEVGTNYEVLQAMREGKIRRDPLPTKEGEAPISESRELGKALDAERKTKQRVAEVLRAKALAVLDKNPIDEQKLIKNFKGVAPLLSAGMHLIQSKSPVLKGFAAQCLEITTGAAGRNNFSASIVTGGKRNKYLQLAGKNVEMLYDTWAKQQKGYTFVEGAWHGKLRLEWNKLVTEARLWEAPKERSNLETPVFHLEVQQAAKVYQRAYKFMADEQRRFRTQGFARLPETSDGYFPRSISSEWYVSASEAERATVAKIISDDLVTVWGNENRKLADSVALRYMEQAADGLYGKGHAIQPSGLTNSSLVEKLLTELGTDKETRKRLLGFLGEGGSKYTKKRIDLDLLKEYTMPDGTVKKLYEVFSTNQQELYQQYARRVSGEVGLAHNGIMGEKMLLQIREAATTYARRGEEATDAEVRAFDQVVAEFLGKPFGNQNLVMDNLRLVTSANLLGSAFFPQLSDIFQMMAHLGVSNVIRAIPEFRRIREDIRMGRDVSTDPLLKDIEAEVGIFGYDYDVVTPYTDQSLSNISGAERAGRFTRIVRASGKINQVWTFYHALHSAQQRLSGKLIISQTFQKLKQLKQEGRDTTNFFEDIKGKLIGDMGFESHPELLKRLSNEMDNIATFNEQGHLVKLDFRNAKDTSLVTEFSNVVYRGVGQVITDTRIGESAYIQHSSLAKLLLQFRTIAITATEKQLVRQHGTLGSLQFGGLLAGALIFAIPLYMLKTYSRTIAMGQQEREEYLEKYMSDAAIGHGVMTYAITAGIMPDLVDLAAYTSGSILSNVETDDGSTVGDKIKEAMSVGQRNDITKAIPALGYLGNTSKAIEQLMKEGDVAGVMKQMPAGAMWWNLPFTTGLSNYAREDKE